MILGGNYLDRGGKYVSSTISALLPLDEDPSSYNDLRLWLALLVDGGKFQGFQSKKIEKYKVKTHKKSKENLSIRTNKTIAIFLMNNTTLVTLCLAQQ